MAARSPSHPTWGLVLVRMVLGLLLLTHAQRDFTADGPTPDALGAAVGAPLETAPAFVRDTARSWVADHPVGVAAIWRYGELLIGLSLVLGALVRPFATLGAVAAILGLLWAPNGPQDLHVLALACFAACAVARAGRRMGLDRALDARAPGWLTWTDGRETSPFDKGVKKRPR